MDATRAHGVARQRRGSGAIVPGSSDSGGSIRRERGNPGAGRGVAGSHESGLLAQGGAQPLSERLSGWSCKWRSGTPSAGRPGYREMLMRMRKPGLEVPGVSAGRVMG